MAKRKLQNSTSMLTPSTADVVRLVQITDSHIFSEPEGRLLGLNTRQSFSSVCNKVKLAEQRPDCLLATGDLSQDSSPESYQYLAKQFDALNIDTLWVAGNHDKAEVIERYFVGNNISSNKHLLIGNWQIILLNSSVEGEVYGHLDESELQFMEDLLLKHSDKHALIVLHHHPVDIDCVWLDSLGVTENQNFLDLVKKNKNVKGVVWGHVHQEFDRMVDGARWLACPSSCVQFTPGSTDFSADTKAPGYRALELLSDGQIETKVHRVDNIDFTIDYSVKGY